MCSVARHMESIMLFTLLGLCVGPAVGTEGAVVKDFDVSKVVTVTVGQVQCFLWKLALPRVNLQYSTMEPFTPDLSRQLHPLERKGREWPAGSQVLDDGTPG